MPRKDPKAWRAANVKKIREYLRVYRSTHTRVRNGWKLERVEAARVEQGNACAICRKAFTKTPCTDHKHGSIPLPRGLLCGNCNAAIGFLSDNPETCRAAADYLEKWGCSLGGK